MPFRLRGASCALCLVALGALACADSDAGAERNRQIARELFDAISRADVAKLDALYAEDFELWTAGSFALSGTRGRDEALEGMRMIGSAFPGGLRFTIVAMTVEGDRVAVEAESEGVHASGRPYHNQYHFLMVIRDGKIRRFKEYMDTMHANDVLVQPVAAPAGGAP
jgi:ketosteroid isomerase-like protein